VAQGVGPEFKPQYHHPKIGKSGWVKKHIYILTVFIFVTYVSSKLVPDKK
jgi:hypothetical protein